MKIYLLNLLEKKFLNYSKKDLYAYIMCGNVKIDGATIKDPKLLVDVNCKIEFVFDKYVSRGALKLEKALDQWKIDVKNLVCLDAGCSTGGWTDLLLQRGAKKVYSVDVGYNQLDLKIRTDGRVVVMEKCNIMDIEDLSVDIGFADISFRSIIFPAKKILSFTKLNRAVVLIKPQFEWKNPSADFTGVVKRDSDLKEILEDTRNDFKNADIKIVDEIESPILGQKGNREFLFLIEKII